MMRGPRIWAAPIAYNWRWAGAPWRAYYGAYFQPYPTYLGPSYWLTDYILADLLAQEYAVAAANQFDAEQPMTAIDDGVKNQIRTQVEDELNNQQPAVTPDASLTDLNHIFVVSQDLNAVGADSAPCSLTAGDLVRLAAVPTQDDQVASVLVVTAKRGSCTSGSQLSISIQDLQAMENDFHAKIENGVTEMDQTLPQQQ